QPRCGGGCRGWPEAQALTRLKSIRQLTSQVAPPSGEKACSQWADVAVIFDHWKRILIGRPSRVSSPTNVPSPSLKAPYTGGSMWVGYRASSHQIAQRPVFGSKARSPTA